MSHWDNGYMDSGWGVVMTLGMLGFWVLIALAVVWLLRTTGSRPGGAPTGAEQVLAERLARGEIDSEEYRDRMTALRSSG